MAEFTYRPTYGVEASTKPRVLEATFGDGYTQRVANGMNTMMETWNLTFSNLPESVAVAIDTFFRARGGVEAFTWKTPRDSVATKNFLCREWKTVYADEDKSSVQASFEQVPA